MTCNIMQTFIESIDFSVIKKGLIHEFDIKAGQSIGISFEIIEGEDVYVYNIFAGDEYINISATGTKEKPVTEDVIGELTEVWNQTFHS